MSIQLFLSIIGAIISIISIIFVVINFALNRKDKATCDNGNTQYKWGQIETKIDFMSKQIQEVLNKIDKFDIEIDDKITKAIIEHEKIYHKKGDI